MKKSNLINYLITTTALASLFTAGISEVAVGVSDETKNENASGIIVSIEAPTVQTTQIPNADEYFVVDFNDQSTGTSGFSKSNDDTTYTYSSDLEIKSADQWGGAEGSQFITQESIDSIRSYKININQPQKYFGFWWSAGDQANKITFKNNGTVVAEFETKDLVDFIQSSSVTNTDEYYGNPAYEGNEGGHKNEPFSYVNVYFKQSPYDEIVVATLTDGGAAFESDNHTFSTKNLDPTGTLLPGSTPAGINDTIITDEDTSITSNVLDNDINPNNDLSISKITINGKDYDTGKEISLSSGALLTVESDGQTTYNPNNKFESFTEGSSNTDKFTYTLLDSNSHTDTAEVTMLINGVADAPITADNSYTTDEDTSIEMTVLQNDTDADTAKEKLTITKINGISFTNVNEKITLDSGATVELKLINQENRTTRGKHGLKYDPLPSDSIQLLNEGQTHQETFTYTVMDDTGETATGNVTIDVTGITDTVAD